jgi:hypothetical protein
LLKYDFLKIAVTVNRTVFESIYLVLSVQSDTEFEEELNSLLKKNQSGSNNAVAAVKKAVEDKMAALKKPVGKAAAAAAKPKEEQKAVITKVMKKEAAEIKSEVRIICNLAN